MRHGKGLVASQFARIAVFSDVCPVAWHFEGDRPAAGENLDPAGVQAVAAFLATRDGHLVRRDPVVRALDVALCAGGISGVGADVSQFRSTATPYIESEEPDRKGGQDPGCCANPAASRVHPAILGFPHLGIRVSTQAGTASLFFAGAVPASLCRGLERN